MTSIVKLLLENGANPNAGSEMYYMQPLPYLIQHIGLDPDVYLNLIKLFINFGATVDMQELISSSSQIKKEFVDKVIKLIDEQKKLKTDAKNYPTEEALRQAIINNQPYLVKILIKMIPVTLEDFELAKEHNHELIARLLLDQLKIIRPLIVYGLPKELANYIANLDK